MKTIIKIDKATIKINPNAGNTRTHVMGMQTIAFTGTCTQKELDELCLEKDIIITSASYPKNELINIEGLIEHPDFDITKLPGKWQVNNNKNINTFHHLPELKYLFSYENTEVKCSSCNSMVIHSKIDNECDDYTCYDICPVCEKTDTFDYAFEDIYTVAKELGV